MKLDKSQPELVALKGKTIALATWGVTHDGVPFVSITTTEGETYTLIHYPEK